MNEKRGRGRPKGAGIVNPEALLETVLDSIAAHGYDGLSMRGLARTHNVSLATVQHHFGTKRELWEAAITHFFDSISQRRQRLSDSTLDARIREALEASSMRPGLLAAILGDRSEGHETRLAFVGEQCAQMFDEATVEIDRERSAGKLRPIDNRALQILMFVGIGAIAGTPEAVFELFGYNLADNTDRATMAQALADIIGFGIYKNGS